MSELPQPIAPLPAPITAGTPATEADIHNSLHGLQPGLYTASDLYNHYKHLALAAGRTPATHAAYGRALTRLGYQPRHDASGTRRCRVIQ